MFALYLKHTSHCCDRFTCCRNTIQCCDLLPCCLGYLMSRVQLSRYSTFLVHGRGSGCQHTDKFQAKYLMPLVSDKRNNAYTRCDSTTIENNNLFSTCYVELWESLRFSLTQTTPDFDTLVINHNLWNKYSWPVWDKHSLVIKYIGMVVYGNRITCCILAPYISATYWVCFMVSRVTCSAVNIWGLWSLFPMLTFR